jgi:surfactin synthase thioesterase subunit
MRESGAASAWFPFARGRDSSARRGDPPRASERVEIPRLFCFPYAGAGASVFLSWTDALAEHLDVWAVQPPGRETRLREPSLARVEDVVDALLPALLPFADRPFALFGHSLGALVAFELARRLERDGERRPVHVFVSGAGAPHRPRTKPPIRHLPDAEFRREIARTGGTPSAVIENEELMELFLPMLRADFTQAETYSCGAADAIDAPITALGGTEDVQVDRARLAAWAELTRAACRRLDLPGGHFFLRESRDPLLEVIARTLASTA